MIMFNLIITLILCLFFTIVFTFDIRNHKNWPKDSEEQCGLSRSMRIIGGTVATPGQYPWIVRVGMIKNLGDMKFESYFCGGSLISNLYIITAAHCVFDEENNDNNYMIQLGAMNNKGTAVCENNVCTDEPITIDVIDVTIHEDYNPNTEFNDIALMKLNDSVSFTEWIKPVCLPFGEIIDEDNVGKMLEVAGWGLTDSKKFVTSNDLLYVKIPVQNNSICVKSFGDRFSERQVCAGGEVGKDSCNGDSGGPAVSPENSDLGPRYFLLGIVSFGPKTCGIDKPAVYTNVKYYMKWILDHME